MKNRKEGQMSNEWKMVRLGDVGNIVTGNTPKTSNLANYNSQDVCFYKPSDIGETVKFLTDSENKISATALNEARELPISSVLVSCIGIIGKIGILTNKAISNQQINAIIPNEDYDSKFLAYSLLFNRPRLQSIANAPVVPIINKTTFSNFTLFVPSLERQREIAAVLDKASELVEKRKAQLAELDLLAESVFYDMFGDPVTNTKGWEICKVIEKTKCIVPGRDKPKSFTGDIPWITTADLNHLGYTSKASLFLSIDEIAEVKAKIIPKGSVIMTCVGDLGVISITGNEMIINQQLHAFICDDNVNNIFLAYNLSQRKDFMYKMASSTTVPYMNKTICNSIPIMLPPLALQQQFAERIEKIEEQKAKVKTALKESENLFQRLMQDMFNPDYHNS